MAYDECPVYTLTIGDVEAILGRSTSIEELSSISKTLEGLTEYAAEMIMDHA